MTKFQIVLVSGGKKFIEAEKVSLSGDYLTFATGADGVVLGIRHEYVLSFETVPDGEK